MYFQEEPEHITILRRQLKRFVEEEMPRELVRQWDRDMPMPRDVVKKLADLRVCGLNIDEEYGDLGRDIVAAIVVVEELSRRSMHLSGPFIHIAFYGGMNISESGSYAQKREYLPKLAKGELLVAYGLSEPDVGGDLAAVQTTARRTQGGDAVVINGTKRWCSGAREADYIYCLVKSDPDAGRYKNLSFVLVPTDSPGISFNDIAHTGIRYSPTGDVIFDEVEVPASQIVGGDAGWNAGWPKLIGPALDVERLEITACALGMAHAAVDDAWNYAQERRQFGKLISVTPGRAPCVSRCEDQTSGLRSHALSCRVVGERRAAVCGGELHGQALCRRDRDGDRPELSEGHGGIRPCGRVRHGALCPRSHVYADRRWKLQYAAQ